MPVMPRGPLQKRDGSPALGGRRKVVLITRGASRLGQALTLGLAGAGFDVAVEVVEAPGVAAHLNREVRRRGRRIRLLDRSADPMDPEEELLRAVRRDFGRLDAVVTVPGPPPTDGDDTPGRTLEEPFRVVRHASPLLRASQGAVVHCLDAGSPFGAEPLRALTQTMARVLAPWIRVNAVAPPAPDQGPGPHPPPPVKETVRSVLYVLASPHLNGEVIRVGPSE